MEREDRLPGLDDDLLAELDRLGEDDLLLGGEERDLADLLEVHPDRVVDPDHVRGQRLELLGRRLFDLLRGRASPARPCRRGTTLVSAASTASSVDDLDAELRRAGLGVLVRGQVDVVVVESSSSTSSETGAATPSARRGRIEASFASSSSRRVRRGRDASTASTSCLSRGSAMSAGPPSSSDAGSVLGRGQPAATGARARSRVWSRRRSSDRRCSLRRRRSSDRRSIVSRSASRSASAIASRLKALRSCHSASSSSSVSRSISYASAWSPSSRGFGPGTRDQRLAERPALLVEAVEDRRQRVRRPHAVVVAGAGDDDGAVQLAGDLATAGGPGRGRRGRRRATRARAARGAAAPARSARRRAGCR